MAHSIWIIAYLLLNDFKTVLSLLNGGERILKRTYSSPLMCSFTIHEELRIPAADSLPLHVMLTKCDTSKLPFPSKVSEPAQPVLFIHGSFHSAWCWSQIIPAFVDSNKYCCYSVALRGTSETGIPAGSAAKTVQLTEHVSDVTQVVQYITSKHRTKLVVIAHSFGGVIAMKLAENHALRAQMNGLALLCSVPPSGNGPMTMRFIKRNFFNALKIVNGFVFKAATKDPKLCRELFFGDEDAVSPSSLDTYMERFKRDSAVGLDVTSLGPILPAKTSAVDGVAVWARNQGEPACLVLGGEKDFIVDREGVEETANYLGVKATILRGEYHDLMLGSAASRTADLLLDWLLRTTQ